MKIAVKAVGGEYIKLGEHNDTKPYDIYGDCSEQQFVWTVDGKINSVNTYIFIKDLITITDLDGNTVSIDSDTDSNIIYNLSPIINVRTIGHGHLVSNQRIVDGIHITLVDSENKCEILINKEPKHYEVSVHLY